MEQKGCKSQRKGLGVTEYNTDIRAWCGCCTLELSGTVITSIRPLQDWAYPHCHVTERGPWGSSHLKIHTQLMVNMGCKDIL